MNTLLITATIKPLVKVKHCDPKVRCEEYLRNLKRYICESDFDVIVFAENSGYAFDVQEIYALAEKEHKRFYYLNLSESADGGNMSTGEARLMQQALEQCCFYNDDNDVVWKVTGRIYIRNVNKILEKADRCVSRNQAIFLYTPMYDSIQTWFFRARVGDLKKYLLTDSTIKAMEGRCIEYAWMDCYREHGSVLKIAPFPIYPDAEGVNSSGQPYTLPRWKRFMKNILLKAGRFTVRFDRPTKNREGL